MELKNDVDNGAYPQPTVTKKGCEEIFYSEQAKACECLLADSGVDLKDVRGKKQLLLQVSEAQKQKPNCGFIAQPGEETLFPSFGGEEDN